MSKYSDKYKLAVRRNFFKILSSRALTERYGKNPKFGVVFSSRGCPYRCIFCCSDTRRRVRSPENVVGEAEFCVKEFQTHCLVFYDDLFTTSAPTEIERIIRMCELIKGRALDVFWEVELRADVVRKLGSKVLGLMNEVGCCTINMGLEKGNDKGLSWLRKDLTTNDIRSAVELLRASGDFVINGTFILGGAMESEWDILDTISFSRDIGRY